MKKRAKNEFLQSYEKFADDIFRHCFFRVRDRDQAVDLMQDTFAKTWQYISDGNVVDDLHAFLYRVANNLIIDYYRKKKSFSLEASEEDSGKILAINEDENVTVINVSDGSIAFEALGELEEMYRQVIVMRFVDGLSPKEIAEIIGESQNNVSVRLNRAIKQLRDILQIKQNERRR